MFSKIFKISSLIILTGIFLAPGVSFAQANPIGFSSGPNAVFVNFDPDSGEGAVAVSGKVSAPNNFVQSSAIISLAVMTSMPNVLTFTGPYNITFDNSDGNLFDPAYPDFSLLRTQNFIPGTTYYFIVRVTGSLGAAGSGTYQEAVEITAPTTIEGDDATDLDDVECADATDPDDVECADATNTITPEPDLSFTETLHNPINQDVDILSFLQKLFSNIVKVLIPFLVIIVIWSGFKFVEAQGNPEKIADAQKNFLYVIIGALILLASWTIATVLKGTVDQFSADIFIINHIINLV